MLSWNRHDLANSAFITFLRRARTVDSGIQLYRNSHIAATTYVAIRDHYVLVYAYHWVVENLMWIGLATLGTRTHPQDSRRDTLQASVRLGNNRAPTYFSTPMPSTKTRTPAGTVFRLGARKFESDRN